MNDDIIDEYIAKLKTDYENKDVVTFVRFSNVDLVRKLVNGLYDDGLTSDKYPVVFLMGSTNETASISCSSSNNGCLNGHYHILMYDYENITDIYELIGEPNPKKDFPIIDDVYLLITGYVDMLNHARDLITTTNVLDLVNVLYFTDFIYPGGKAILCNNDLVSATWFRYKYTYESSTYGFEKVSEYSIKTDFIANDDYNSFYDEKCYLVDLDNNITAIEYIRILIITEYSNSYDSHLFLRFFEYVVNFMNENV